MTVEATQEIVESFRNREFIGLASVVKYTKGFDDPDVMCGIDARPNSGSLVTSNPKNGSCGAFC